MTKLLVLLLLSPLAFAEKNEMVPLGDFLEQAGELDDSESLYFNYRCLGLYTMIRGLFLNAPQKGASDTLMGIEAAQSDLILISEFLYNELTPKDKRNFTDNMTRTASSIAKKYQLEANNSWTNNGSYFNDFIMSDSQWCEVALKEFKKTN